MMSFFNFQLKANQTSLRTEFLAGLTTYLTMAYILFVNPNILGKAGMDPSAVFMATAIVCALGCLLQGFLGRYPIAIAPSMGTNVYFAYVVVLSHHYPWQQALGFVVLTGFLFLLINLTPFRYYVLRCFPESMVAATAAGIGLLIGLIALQTSQVIVASPNTLVTLGNLHDISVLLFFVLFLLIILLRLFEIPAALIIVIFIGTVLGHFAGIGQFAGVFSLPPTLSPTLFKWELPPFSAESAAVLLAFLLMLLFDSVGTLTGLLADKSLFPQKKVLKQKRIGRSLIVQSMATASGGLLGTASTSPYIESAAGIRVGGRTGLTSLFIALFFLASLFFAPLVKSIPTFAVTPVLFYVACEMVQQIRFLNAGDYTEIIPALVTFILIPLSFSIAMGIGIGLIFYVLLKLFSGKYRECHPLLVFLAVVFSVFFIIR